MNNIRQIIADKIANLKDKRVNDYADGFNDGLFEAFKIFLEEIPAPRTEADILKDFEKLGYAVVDNNKHELILVKDMRFHLMINKELKHYMVVALSPILTMQEHKLLNELFEVWGWI